MLAAEKEDAASLKNLAWERANWPLVIFSVQEEEKRKAKEEEEKREYEEYLKLKESFVVEEEGVEEAMTEEQVRGAGSAVPLLLLDLLHCLVWNEFKSRSQPKVFAFESWIVSVAQVNPGVFPGECCSSSYQTPTGCFRALRKLAGNEFCPPCVWELN